MGWPRFQETGAHRVWIAGDHLASTRLRLISISSVLRLASALCLLLVGFFPALVSPFSSPLHSSTTLISQNHRLHHTLNALLSCFLRQNPASSRNNTACSLEEHPHATPQVLDSSSHLSSHLRDLSSGEPL